MTDTDLPSSSLPRFSLRGFIDAVIPVLALALLVVAAVTAERLEKGTANFLTLENILNLLRQLSPIGIVALGMTFAITLGGIDLSVGSIVALAGVIGIYTMNVVMGAAGILSDMADARQNQTDLPYAGFTEWLARTFIHLHLGGSETAGVILAFVLMLFTAAVVGGLNGVLIARGKIPPFIATLAGFAAYRSVALAIADGGASTPQSQTMFQSVGRGGIALWFLKTRQGTAAVLPYPVIAFLILAVCSAMLLNRTRFGRYLIAIGSNERAAIYSAIYVSRIKFLTYLLVGIFCGLCAMLVSAYLNSVSSSQTGNMYELDAIAAVVIGGTRMSGGSGTIFGTVVGVLILGVIGNMLNFLNVSPYLQGLVKGCIIVLAVLVQRFGRKEGL